MLGPISSGGALDPPERLIFACYARSKARERGMVLRTTFELEPVSQGTESQTIMMLSASNKPFSTSICSLEHGFESTSDKQIRLRPRQPIVLAMLDLLRSISSLHLFRFLRRTFGLRTRSRRSLCPGCDETEPVIAVYPWTLLVPLIPPLTPNIGQPPDEFWPFGIG